MTTRYVYDSAGRLLAEADGNNTITRYYLYGAGLLAVVTPDGHVYGYQADPSGNVIAVADQNAYAYDPFGRIADQQEKVVQPFKFAGQVGIMSEPNGLYYMKARYYDSKAGRFISEDPSGFGGGDVNLSVYVRENPINLTDPSGLCAIYGEYSQATSSATKASPYLLGKAGEDAVAELIGEEKNTTAFPINGRSRIPDFVTDDAIHEVKNVNSLSLTSQIRDYLDLSGSKQFVLWTRPSTNLSGPLKSAINSGIIIRNDIPGTK